MEKINTLSPKEVALFYLETGKVPFPVKQKDKRPYLPGLKYKDSYPEGTIFQDDVLSGGVEVTEEVIEDWWTHWPEAQVGLVCGQVGKMSVVDIDTPEHEVNAVLAPHTQKLWDFVKDKTLCVQTGGGGYQAYFQYHEALGGDLAEDVQSRNNKQYVVAPPSIHPSGNRYKVLNNLPLAPFPKKEIEEILGKKIKKGLTPEEAFRPSVVGNRNNKITAAVGHIFNTGANYEGGFSVATGLNMTFAQPLPLEELQNIVTSIWAKHQKKVNTREIKNLDKTEDKQQVSLDEAYMGKVGELCDLAGGRDAYRLSGVLFGLSMLLSKKLKIKYMAGDKLFATPYMLLVAPPGTGKTIAKNIINTMCLASSEDVMFTSQAESGQALIESFAGTLSGEDHTVKGDNLFTLCLLQEEITSTLNAGKITASTLIDNILSLYMSGGKTTRYDKMKGYGGNIKRKNIFLENCRFSIFGLTTPSAFAKTFNNLDDKGRGLTDRFMIFYPRVENKFISFLDPEVYNFKSEEIISLSAEIKQRADSLLGATSPNYLELINLQDPLAYEFYQSVVYPWIKTIPNEEDSSRGRVQAKFALLSTIYSLTDPEVITLNGFNYPKITLEASRAAFAVMQFLHQSVELIEEKARENGEERGELETKILKFLKTQTYGTRVREIQRALKIKSGKIGSGDIHDLLYHLVKTGEVRENSKTIRGQKIVEYLLEDPD